MVKATFLLVICAVVVCFAQQGQAAAFIQKLLTFDNCSPGSVFNVQRLDVNPYPPRLGRSVNLKASFTSKKRVTGGTVRVSVEGKGMLSFINLEQTYNLCSVIPTSCPIQEGPLSFSITRNIPNLPISGTFDVKIEATGDQGESLLCAKLPLEIDD